MSDEMYYTVLNVKESASSAEIKTAYRVHIKQVHPDTKANLAPYLRKIAEDKAKELIEAYTVLSNLSKRRDYDRQLADYRRQTMAQAPPAPPPTASTASSGYCNKCGASLCASGYCPKCIKFATPAAAPSTSPPRPQAIRWLGDNWQQVMLIVVFAVLFYVVFIDSLFPHAKFPANTSQLRSDLATQVKTKNLRSAITDASRFLPKG